MLVPIRNAGSLYSRFFALMRQSQTPYPIASTHRAAGSGSSALPHTLCSIRTVWPGENQLLVLDCPLEIRVSNATGLAVDCSIRIESHTHHLSPGTCPVPDSVLQFFRVCTACATGGGNRNNISSR